MVPSRDMVLECLTPEHFKRKQVSAGSGLRCLGCSNWAATGPGCLSRRGQPFGTEYSRCHGGGDLMEGLSHRVAAAVRPAPTCPSPAPSLLPHLCTQPAAFWIPFSFSLAPPCPPAQPVRAWAHAQDRQTPVSPLHSGSETTAQSDKPRSSPLTWVPAFCM